ncbi:hypothetical protein ACFQHN_10845 [Natrialbaceae archaeon GCM10025896]
MSIPSNAACTDCGAVFPRRTAETERGNDLECPECGHTVIRGVPTVRGTEATDGAVTCLDCGAVVPRADAVTKTKGVLACPVCGSTALKASVDDTRDR